MPPAQNIHPVGRLSGKCVFLTRTSLTQVPDRHTSHIDNTGIEKKKEETPCDYKQTKRSKSPHIPFAFPCSFPSHRIASHRISYAPNIPHPQNTHTLRHPTIAFLKTNPLRSFPHPQHNPHPHHLLHHPILPFFRPIPYNPLPQ